jgi:alkyl hydroperoxide reductase subunit F
MLDLVIIGAGPSGLAAAVYAVRQQLKVLMLSLDVGGKTNYRLQLPHLDQHLAIPGEEVISRFAQDIPHLPLAREVDRVEQIEPAGDGYAVHTQQDHLHLTRAIIIASGAHAKPLSVPGEAEFLMRGVCYSALSYAPLFADRPVVVVGDGALALRAAAELARTARRVTLVASAPIDTTSPLTRSVLAASNVVILTGYRAIQVNGDRYARSLTITNGTVTQDLEADGFFVAQGLVPNSGFVAGLVAQNSTGAIRVNQRNQTSAPGIFAAGDVTNVGAEQVLIAIGEGVKAALSADDYLLQQQAVAEPESALPEWR